MKLEFAMQFILSELRLFLFTRVVTHASCGNILGRDRLIMCYFVNFDNEFLNKYEKYLKIDFL
jgi:hypothetical protein